MRGCHGCFFTRID
ncbi:MAG: hypothetical protein LC677_12445 [Halomonas sp.]|nr:hypothetical protein [Halomonas sp.]